MKDQKIIDYMSITQPALDKYAKQEKTFMGALQTKMSSLVKAGSIKETEANRIIKEAKANPASIFNHLDVQTFRHHTGSVGNRGNSSDEKDPLYRFAFS